jgi:hypothetical protein
LPGFGSFAAPFWRTLRLAPVADDGQAAATSPHIRVGGGYVVETSIERSSIHPRLS